MTNTLDLTDLQNEVIDKWENDGVRYTTTENVGYTSPDPEFISTILTPNAELILSSVEEMIDVLGFDSISSYLASKQEDV